MKTDESRVVLRDGLVADLRPAPRLQKVDLWLEGDRIAAVGGPPPGWGDPSPRMASVVDCSGCLVLPGLVCGHGHLYSALATGMPGPAVAPTNFVEILERVWWRLDEALDAASLRASALVGAMGAVRAGTTCIIDHHASPSFIDGSLDVIADALEEVGLRSVLCYEVTDRGGAGRRDAGVRENERFLGADRRLSRGLVGGHAGFTMGLYAASYSMALIPQTYSQAFTNEARIWVVGGPEAVEVDRAFLVEFYEPMSGMTYAAASYPDEEGRETGLGARMLNRAQALADAEEWSELAYFVDTIDVIRSLSWEYGMALY